MGSLTEETIRAIAHSIDITGLSEEAAKALAPDAEYHLRQLLQDALKFARHGRRTRLTTEDVNAALRARNVEPVYGFANRRDAAKYVRAAGAPDLLFALDRELPLGPLIDRPLPKAPVEDGVVPHWLAIAGRQPVTAANVPLEPPAPKRPRGAAAAAAARGADGTAGAPSGRRAAAAAAAAREREREEEEGGGAGAASGAPGPDGATVVPPVRHLVHQELRVYFDGVVAILKGEAPPATAGAGAPPPGGPAPPPTPLDPADKPRLQRLALASLATDPGLHPLAPYFTQLVEGEVRGGTRDLERLHAMLSLARALLANPHVDLGPYLHQLMPSVLTCVVFHPLGAPGQDHWALRDAAARLLAAICEAHAEPGLNLLPRVCRTLVKAVVDRAKPLPTHYGAVAALAALGPKARRRPPPPCALAARRRARGSALATQSGATACPAC